MIRGPLCRVKVRLEAPLPNTNGVRTEIQGCHIWQTLVVISTDPAGHDHVRARGMHDLRYVASALYFVKINSVVSSTITFIAQACVTLPPYTKDMSSRSIWLGGMLLGQFLSLLQMFALAFPNCPSSVRFIYVISHLLTKYSLHL
jgi:hypothetical protein